jgi:superfamily II DNA helicase RecQ
MVSPLISLMEDQVHKLNALRPGTAVMLGSAQSSADTESRVSSTTLPSEPCWA